MNRRAKVCFPVFNGYEVRLILARDLAATGRRLNADLSDCCAAYVPPDPERPKRVWIVFGPDATDPGTISHEASHAIRAMLAFVGARNDNETFAYHLDFLVGKIHKFLRRK